MEDRDREPLATIALIAAFVDGFRGPEEVEQLKQIATEIGGSDYDTIARKVLSGGVRLGDVVSQLSTDDARKRAYELAVCVVHADGVINEKEKAFLADLHSSLGLDAAATADLDQTATLISQATSAPAPAAPPPVAPPAAPPAPDAVAAAASSSRAALDDMILKNAMLTGALELLPQNLATLAIIPLQLRMVYRIGQDHGQKLDMEQVKDLAGVLGIGAAGQVMEGVARKVLGGLASGLLGRMVGGVVGGVAGVAGGAALTFATTYALGHAARQYYAQGRSLSRADLQQLFAKLKTEAAGLFPKVESQIRSQASSLNLGEVMQRVRG